VDLQNLTSALCVYLGDNKDKVNFLSATKYYEHLEKEQEKINIL